MPLLRRSSLNQLKRIDSEINKKDTEDKKVFNLMWAHNPIKSDKKGVRKIATFDELFKTDIPDSPTKVEFKNEKIDMKNEILSFEKMFENGPNDTPQEIMKNMKTIQNWFGEPEYDSKREMKVNLIGKPVKTDKINGYINRIEGEYIFIESIIEPFGIIKMKMKEFVKMFKPIKDSNTIMSFSIYGPNDKTDSSAPNEGDSNGPKIDSKGQKVKDQKISDKNNIVKIMNYTSAKD